MLTDLRWRFVHSEIKNANFTFRAWFESPPQVKIYNHILKNIPARSFDYLSVIISNVDEKDNEWSNQTNRTKHNDDNRQDVWGVDERVDRDEKTCIARLVDTVS